MAEGMRAWWREDGELRFGRRARPELVAADDVRVRVVIAGLCRTDVAVAEGRLACVEPCVLGHEVAGVVEAVGPSVRRLAVGDRVACLPRVDGARLGVDRDGGFAELLVVPERALAKVPPGLAWRHAAFVEPVAACLAVTHAPLQGRVRVLGEGRIATLTRRLVVALGHELVDVDPHERAARGVECDVEREAAREDEEGAPVVDVAIETRGTAASLTEAMRCVNDGGLVVLKSRPAAPIAFDVAEAVTRGLRLHAVGWAPFDEAFAMLARISLDDLLGDVRPLDALRELLGAREDTKVFLAPDVGEVWAEEPASGATRSRTLDAERSRACVA
ncbi:MAG: alcohol dehydrogenase catalytic domain-containing protein [Myxococcota bacterium]|jgi:threonine dehydrogenase-like Zn-dependent dehydrogenase|nr:alcohol dehydrogenase catalytic domain-containing protein [Myxococcota bacterium]